MIKDVKKKNINVIVALKLDRLTRIVYDIESSGKITFIFSIIAYLVCLYMFK